MPVVQMNGKEKTMQLQTLEAQALLIGWIIEKCNIRQYRYALHPRNGKSNGFLFRTLAELEKTLHQLESQ